MITPTPGTTPNRKSKGLPPALLLALGILLAGACVLLFVLQGLHPSDAGLLRGSSSLAVDYSMTYKPNALYDTEKLGDKEARLLAYVDKLHFMLQYQLHGLQELPAEYTVSAEALLVAQASDSGKYIDPDFIVWQKRYPLLAPERISSDGSQAALERQADVNIGEVVDFAKSVYETTQVRTVNELKVIFRVDAVIHGPTGDTTDTSTVEYIIPMLDNLLVVTGTPTGGNAIELRTTPAAAKANYLPWALLLGAAALAMIAWGGLLLASAKKQPAQNLFARNTAKIFQQYGERLVRLENPLPYQHLATIPIDGIAEMVKIADEISQPVFYYKVDTSEEKKIEFYVFDTGRIYYMVMFGDMSRESVATA